ncbi:DeoR/GlpR family DNA-binding transcription regulator [Clostridium sp. BJN0001]|uniref:DeoR/GlpR family DNA-binding transcription regulator n=1 Tax=Clostridium sp. BJN0001 TaxID=2930219 RepID=UPI001FD39020|nr:DeoR/GlpR family DNA-binding transcription regulator [Clostridium sp. BJN0001]
MRTNNSLVSKRRSYILKHLKSEKQISTSDLSERLNVSPLTLRRDLQELEKEGLVMRYYGGAKLVEDNPLVNEIDVNDDSLTANENKQKISKYAASFIEDGDTIFINSSSTALCVLDYIGDKRVTVITNNVKAIYSNVGENVDLILTGGQIYKRKLSLVGDFAATIFSSVIADKCFIGVSGISADFGITTSVFQETLINKAMMHHCKGPVFVLTVSSKIGKKNKFLSGDIHDISHIVTDNNLSEKSEKCLKDSGIEVIKV